MKITCPSCDAKYSIADDGLGTLISTFTPSNGGPAVTTDYEWSGLPDRLPAGTYPLTLRNDGPDVHEIQVFRNTDDLSLPDLFALGPVEMKARVELAGGAIVVPGATSEETTLQLEPGTYEVVCFVPAATDQRPHFDHGMHRTLVVD